MTLRTIDPHAAKRLLDAGAILVDIREGDEFAREHIPGVRQLALSQLAVADFAPDGRPVIFHCRSGARTRSNAAALAAKVDETCEVFMLEGGLEAWRKAGLPTVVDRGQPIELQRQVQIGAGGLAFLGTILGLTVSPWFLAVPLFVGGGLLFAGLTGFCGMALLLDVNFQEVVHSVLTGNAEVAKQQRFAEDRMDTHKNAPLTPKGREQMVRAIVEGGLTTAGAARRFNTTPKTVSKWVDRFRTEGVEGLRDRSSRPLSSPGQTPQATCAAVEAMRRQRYTGEQIAVALAISPATVSRILRRLGLNRLSALEPAEPVRRYERENPGELIHIDIKKLGKFNQIGHRITGDRRGQSNSRGVGWEYVHVGIDDHSRIAFAKIMPNQKTRSAIAFLKAAVAYYASLAVKIERVMTDNGSCYRSFAFRRACERLGLRHIRTKPYTPKTNGKVERFIQTSLREWAYAQAYLNSSQRQAELPTWLHRYNWHRPHAGIGGRTPISRLGLTEDNVLRLHS